MSDIETAIAELQRQTHTDTPWVSGDFLDRPALAAELATILQAVVSGDLITLKAAEAELAHEREAHGLTQEAMREFMADLSTERAARIAAEAELARVRIALHDAINRPKGTVPESADEFYEAPRVGIKEDGQ